MNLSCMVSTPVRPSNDAEWNIAMKLLRVLSLPQRDCHTLWKAFRSDPLIESNDMFVGTLRHNLSSKPQKIDHWNTIARCGLVTFAREGPFPDKTLVPPQLR